MTRGDQLPAEFLVVVDKLDIMHGIWYRLHSVGHDVSLARRSHCARTASNRLATSKLTASFYQGSLVSATSQDQQCGAHFMSTLRGEQPVRYTSLFKHKLAHATRLV